MIKKRLPEFSLLLLLIGSIFLMGAKLDPMEEAEDMWAWSKPAEYPQPIPGDLDVATLSALLDSGNLQWYLKRPEPDQWDTIVAIKVHAPPELVWKVMTDYEKVCQYMPKTLSASEVLSRSGNEVKTKYRGTSSVVNFEYNYDIFDNVTENPPYHLHIYSPEGGLKGREIDYYLVPIDNDKKTILFIRHYPHMKSLGILVRTVLAVLPTIEWPVSASASNYMLRSYRQEAEKLAGYKRPPRPGPLDYNTLDIATMRRLAAHSTGLIRETNEGKILEGLNFTFVNAPPDQVWEVLIDFENYHQFFLSDPVVIEKREGDQVLLRQKSTKFSVSMFTFGGQEMVNRYTMEPPGHLSFKTVGGIYEGSSGDYRIIPVEGGKKTLLIHSLGMNLDRDNSMTMRMVKSGAFPFDTMLCLTMCRTALLEVKTEAEKRAGKSE